MVCPAGPGAAAGLVPCRVERPLHALVGARRSARRIQRHHGQALHAHTRTRHRRAGSHRAGEAQEDQTEAGARSGNRGGRATCCAGCGTGGASNGRRASCCTGCGTGGASNGIRAGSARDRRRAPRSEKASSEEAAQRSSIHHRCRSRPSDRAFSLAPDHGGPARADEHCCTEDSLSLLFRHQWRPACCTN